MNVRNKLCDAADWFRPEIVKIIEHELREVPRFHRKQWEFAMIFHALQALGKLGEDKIGLSMGGGKERIAYALAPHVRQLVITDLYETETTWDCARTDDPDEFIRRNKPFPVDDAKLKALRMDMRELHFPDRTFDFCYSTCAVEHIGGREDFVKHFNEVARVLKDDGVYVFTTEVLLEDEPIRDEHNYVFSLPFLSDLFAESDLMLTENFDARVVPHRANSPLPSSLRQLTDVGFDHLVQALLEEAPHIQLLRGKHPFTCGIFVMRKRKAMRAEASMEVHGLQETRQFAAQGVRGYAEMLAKSRVSIHPFSLLPGERSRFFVDHTEFFTDQKREPDRETVFHTDYFWFGTGKRLFDIALRVDSSERTGKPVVEIRVHRYKTRDSRNVECVATISSSVPYVGWMMRRLEVETHEDYCYALLAKLRTGTCVFDRIEIKSAVPGAAGERHGSSNHNSTLAA
jgi:SAM-dependent methyltransferase